MIFINEIKYLQKEFSNRFDPKPYTHKDDIKGHCIYGYLREHDDANGPAMSLRYIGEGRPNRPTEDHRCRVPSVEYIVIFQDNITKDQALSGEKLLVDYFGRIINGTGLLENVREGGGGWGAKGLSWSLDVEPCQYCGINYARLDIHEKACAQNPSKSGGHNTGRNHYKVNCRHCCDSIAVNRLRFHESTCDQNPLKVDSPKKGKKHDTRQCGYCEKVCSVCNIDRHESSCKSNPSRIDGATKGRKSERRGTKLCAECGYVTSCIHMPAE